MERNTYQLLISDYKININHPYSLTPGQFFPRTVGIQTFQTKANMKPENLLRKMLVSFPGQFAWQKLDVRWDVVEDFGWDLRKLMS